MEDQEKDEKKGDLAFKALKFGLLGLLSGCIVVCIILLACDALGIPVGLFPTEEGTTQETIQVECVWVSAVAKSSAVDVVFEDDEGLRYTTVAKVGRYLVGDVIDASVVEDAQNDYRPALITTDNYLLTRVEGT